MATAAFKSTTKRSSIGGADDTTSSSSSGGQRRTRSVSRFSHSLPSELLDFERNPPLPSTRRKFVNTVRGAGFPEISLDDLVIQLFSSGERGRSSDIYSSETVAQHRRGRSVSRQSSSGKSAIGGRSSGGSGRIDADRRRRSLSVVRYRASDSECDHSEKHTCHGNAKTSNTGNKQNAKLHKHVSSPQNRGLRRCSSQADFLKRHDSYSSQSNSSALTDDEACDACYGSDGFENSQSTHSSKKSDLFVRGGASNDQLKAVRNKHRNVVAEEITTGLEQHNRRSCDKEMISRQLKEDAEKIIEDFISSVEDNTDMSSVDGERSDTSSSFGVSVRPRDNSMHFGEVERYKTPPRTSPLPVEMDGVVFPWLLWETSNNDTPQLKHKIQIPAISDTTLHEEEETQSNDQSKGSRGSWSRALAKAVPRRSRAADVDAYLATPSNEELLIERWKLRSMISSGSILMCEGSRGPILL